MKLKHLFFVCAAALFAVACSDDDEGGSKVSGPLATPSNVVYTPTETSIHFEWSKVTNATSYEATLAPEDTPSSKETIETTSTQCDFNNLESGYYIFTVTALYADNPAYNSEAYEMRVGTLGLGVAVLDTPENLTVSAESFDATITWDAVSGAAAYRIVISTGGGAEVINEIVISTTYSATGLSSAMTYEVSVQALLNGSGEASEFDSVAATTSFTTTQALSAPTLTEFLTTHGIAIMKWELSGSAQGEQALTNSDPYDLRLQNEDGSTLRLVEGYQTWNFTKYPDQRIVWGGLEPETTYILGIRRLSTTTGYGASAWATCEVKTEAAPADPNDYLLYWDFENVPYCGNGQYHAYGFNFTADASTDYSDPYNVVLRNEGNAEPGYALMIDLSRSDGKYNQSFLDNYLPGLTLSDFEGANPNCYNIAVCAGHFKFGSGSNPAWVTLPALAELTEATDIVVELDSAPYVEASAQGDYFSPANSDVAASFTFEVTGAGTVDASSLETGDSANGNTVTLKNYSMDEQKQYATDRFTFMHHKIVITGATSATCIKIYESCATDGSNHRMWMDNVTIAKKTE